MQSHRPSENDSGGSWESSHDGSSVGEGYDNEFVPPGHKFECPICLMCLKDPFQTDCGHRFCGGCIKKWLRSEEQGRKCPVCNETLKPSAVYPDNYAKREVYNLQAKCRYAKSGCTVMDTLKTILKHQMICEYREIPCPFDCGSVFMAKDIESHKATECPNRELECPLCHLMVACHRLDSHKKTCATSQNRCPYCKEEYGSSGGGALNLHKCNLPPDDPIYCRFLRFGCAFQATPEEMKKHMVECQVEHLNCLATAMEKSIQEPSLDTTNMQQIEEQLSNMLAMHISPISAQESKPDGTGVSGLLQSIAGAPLERPASPYKEKGMPSSDAAESSAAKGGGKGGEDYFVPSESDVVRDLRNRVAGQQQYILELRTKVSMLETQMLSMRSELKDAHQDLKSRSCKGVYVWKLCNYKKLREESIASPMNCVLHSPGFYTDYNGYRFCMRLNLNGVENAQGTHLSLFIHLMQSDNDDVLYWPFLGKIVLTILDQNPLPGRRKHISETLVAKPGLAAFERPNSFRNHKGFGYMEFAPISFLEHGGERMFIKDDTLLIRADVRPTQPSNVGQ